MNTPPPIYGVTQSRTGYPYGNCVEAAVATLLSLPIEAIPDARSDPESQGLKGEDYLAARNFILHAWLERVCGLTLVEGPGDHPPWIGQTAAPLYWIASGPSPRGLNHVVVMADLDMVWDPHSSREGLKSIEKWMVLVPLAPSDSLPLATRAFLGGFPGDTPGGIR